MTYTKLKVEQRGKIALLTLNDPGALNAASSTMVTELLDALTKIRSGEVAARALVLTGAGRGFCSGADLSDAPPGETLDGGYLLETYFNPLMRALRDFPFPIVTAVNGAAAGIGSSIALMGDLVVAAERAFFMQAFSRVGLVPDGGATWMLPRILGKARAMELMLLGEKLPAAKALDWGLINRVTTDEDLLPEALKLAAGLADGPASLTLTRKLVWQGFGSTYDEALDAERHTQDEATATADAKEGMLAFSEKRAPRFTGR
jgi:2-(1,2-epoxy-1,2-dihydrophenyl)acetyl-CoA isomerase